MSTPTKKNPKYYISPSAITIKENAAYDSAAYVAVSVVSGTLVMLSVAYFHDRIEAIDYTAEQENPTWRLSGYNTFLQEGYNDKKVYLYARLEVGGGAGLIVFSDNDYTVSEGGEELDAALSSDGSYIFLKLGFLTAPSGGRRTLIWDTGCLLTQYGKDHDVENAFSQLFTVEDGRIVPQLNFSALTVDGLLTIAGALVLNDTEIRALRGYAYINRIEELLLDSEDVTVPSCKLVFSYIKEKMEEVARSYLRKDVEDTAAERITFDKGLTANASSEFNSGVQVSGGVDADSVKADDSIDVGEYIEGDAVTFEGGKGGRAYIDDYGKAIEVMDKYIAREKSDFKGGVLVSGGGLDVEGGDVNIDNDLTVGGDTSLQNTTWGTVDGEKGASITMDENGDATLEIGYLKVNKKASFNELEIKSFKHVGGTIVLSPASMTVEAVATTGYNGVKGYVLYAKKTDGDGKTVYNDFVIGDLARCQVFGKNLLTEASGSTRYYWRKVIATDDASVESNDYYIKTFLDNEIRVHGWQRRTFPSSEYFFIVLSNDEGGYDTGSDVPAAGDEVVQLGNVDDEERQNPQILSAYGLKGAAYAPYIAQYRGINSFSLPDPENAIVPGGSVFTGSVTIQPGSTGLENIVGYDKVISNVVGDLGQTFSNNNMLRNTGFTGDYESEDTSSLSTGDSIQYNDPLSHWEYYRAKVGADALALYTSRACAIASGGYIKQDAYIAPEEGETYNLAANIRGAGKIRVKFFGVVKEFTLPSASSGAYVRGVVKKENWTAADGMTVSLAVTSGAAVVCEIMLTKGVVAPDGWTPAIVDVPMYAYRFKEFDYLRAAMREGATTVANGLILSSVIELGNYANGEMKEVTCGMSGIYTEDDDVAVWGGGTYTEAVAAVDFYKKNPSAQPTAAQLAQQANFVLTHGGRAILNDAVVRGVIYASGGEFTGKIHATDAVFDEGVLAKEGIFDGIKARNVTISGALNRMETVITADNFLDYFVPFGLTKYGYAPKLMDMGDCVVFLSLPASLGGSVKITFPYAVAKPFAEGGDNVVGVFMGGAHEGAVGSLVNLRQIAGRKFTFYNKFAGSRIDFMFGTAGNMQRPGDTDAKGPYSYSSLDAVWTDNYSVSLGEGSTDMIEAWIEPGLTHGYLRNDTDGNTRPSEWEGNDSYESLLWRVTPIIYFLQDKIHNL